MARRLFIASSSNARLKAVRRLARTGSGSLVPAEGARALAAALGAGARVHEVYAAPRLYLGPRDAALVAEAEARGARVVEVDAAAFRTLARHARPDGVLALVERPSTSLARLAPGPNPLLAVAAAIERPGNLGTIARTACAAGADALIAADPCTAVFHRDVVRGSVGAIFRLAVAAATAAHTIAWLRERGVAIVVATPGAPTPYWRAAYERAVAVVLGGERHGVPDVWLAAADERVSVPMPGPADSLNVAVAAGVVLFEAARQRGQDS